MTPQLLSSLAGITLSLLFSYIPGLSSWYEILSPTVKRLVMLFLLAMTSLGAFALACSGWLPYFSDQVTVSCTEQGAVDLISAFVLALVANQSTYLITPKREQNSKILP